jgi:hypothetical protein
MGLRQGSEITTTRPSLTSLVINADPVEILNVKREAVIEVSEKDSAEGLFRKIVSLYIQGYQPDQPEDRQWGASSAKRDSVKEMVRGTFSQGNSGEASPTG